MKLIKSSAKLPVVIDANVFVSAFIGGRLPKKVVKLWQEEKITLLLSPFLLAKIILSLQKFDLPQEDLQALKKILENNSVKLIPSRKVSICRDKKDNQILDLCLAGEAHFLVAGDKDLLSLKTFHKTRIVKPREFLQTKEMKKLR